MLQYGDKKQKIIKYAIYAAVILISCLLENSCGKLLTFAGIRVLPAIPVVAAIAMFEREFPSALFGAFAGIILDISSGNDGFNTVVLMLIGAGCSLLISHFMQNNFVTALVLGAGSVAVYQTVYVIVNIVLSDGGIPIRSVIAFYLPALLMTSVFIPLCYGIIKLIYKSRAEW